MSGRHSPASPGPHSAWLELWLIVHAIMLGLQAGAAWFRAEWRLMLGLAAFYALAGLVIWLLTLWIYSGGR